ncbi:MAG: dTMP kinase [Planctomycetota bacterium]|nr:dTMP kinase [Planctomycetota bacterium]
MPDRMMNNQPIREEQGFRPGKAVVNSVADGGAPVDISDVAGRLIVIEGTDGAGRSTHLALLREWLETKGFGVAHTALTKGRLAGDGLRRAKQGHTLGRLTMDLLYATDLADRVENEIIPALRAGFVVLTDRYIYSVMARSIVRGTDPRWVKDVYRFAPKPHAVFYLKVDVPHLTPRVLSAGGFDYWESGMDFLGDSDVYDSFVNYQTRLLKVFDQLADAYRFNVIDATREIHPVFNDLTQGILRVVSDMEGVRA